MKLMDTLSLKQIHDQAVVDYNPTKGWSVCAQPVDGLEEEDYREMAEQGRLTFQDEMINFCDKNSLSYIMIPHEDYHKQFEKTKVPFRTWLNSYCEATGQNPNAHVALVLPNVKPAESSEDKNSTRTADRTKDYLRGMTISLTGKLTQARSLDRLGDVITALESDERSVARKNQYHTPKENGYRGEKAIWEVEIPEGNEYAGWKILGEFKVEHESQQDLNRSTRNWMGIKRHTNDVLMGDFFPRTTKDAKDNYQASKHYKRIGDNTNILGQLSRYLCDAAHKRDGFDRFLDPQIQKAHAPTTTENLSGCAKKATEIFGNLVTRELETVIPKLLTFCNKMAAILK